ncbi:hypothetical protein FRC12_008551 [Ceratobasidium sp. 428]|nr:hypothetical protein FRC12_008551 [Ceratobasidium sp. 428]
MRKAGQASAPNTSTGAGPSRLGSGTPVDSPMEMSPVGMQQHQELPTTQLVDDFVSSIQAEVRPEPESPRDSLFDEDEEDQPAPQMDADIDFGQFAINSPPRAPEPALPPEPQPEPRGLPTRPSVSMDFPPAHNHLDNHAQPYTPSPLVQGLPLQSPVSVIPPLQAGQWHWKGDLYVTTEEPIPGADNDSEGKLKTKAAHHRVCGVIIRDPALPDDTGTKIFTSTLASYVKDKITIQNTSDLHILYAELGAGAFELTQAAWMISPDADEGPDFDLWRGIIRKMELTIQGSIVKIYNANNAQMTRHLLLVPCSLMRKFRRLAPFAPVVEHFKSRTEGLAVIMCKRVQNVVDPEPRPFLAQQIPKYWQQIPPELHSQLKGVKCLVFPHPDAEPESGLLHAELAKCNAAVVEGFDTRGEAEAVFVHRGWVWQLSGLLGLTHRRKRLFRRFYAFGSGGLWRAAEWDVREIWLFGGMVTFTPAALLEDPWIVNKIIETIKDNVTWHAYIEPKVVGTLTLRQTDDDITFALERVLDEIAFSNDFAPYPLALTSPPRHGFFEEFEWVDAQYARADKTSEGLRTSCEEEVINAYKKELEEAPKTTQPVKAKSKEPETNGGGWGDGNGQGSGGGEGWGASNGNNEGSWGESNGGGGGGGDGGGWGDSTSNGNAGWGESSGGWGNASGAANGWGSPVQNQPGSPTQTALPRSNAGTPAPHNEVDLSQIASDKRIRELSDDVIEGLKTMQIQPCFMREIRRFIVIDSKARAKEKKERESKLEVEVITAEQFIKEFTENS